jgi:hypothetical protein
MNRRKNKKRPYSALGFFKLFGFFKLLNYKKMESGNKKQRPIDQAVSRISRSLASRFVIASKMEIKTWKALAVIVFAAGFSAAFVWSVYNKQYIESQAEGELVAHWKFDEGSGNVVKDSSGHNNQGMVFGATWSSQCVSGSCLSFDGKNDYIEIPSSASLSPSDAITVEMWVRPSAETGGNVYLLNKRQSYLIHHTRKFTKTPRFYVFNAATSESSDFLRLPLDQWSHLTGTYDKNNPKNNLNSYLNGVLADPKPADRVTFSGSIRQNDNKIYIGAYGSTTGFFKGIIDEVKIYNKSLKAQEIADHYVAFASEDGKCEGSEDVDNSPSDCMPRPKEISETGNFAAIAPTARLVVPANFETAYGDSVNTFKDYLSRLSSGSDPSLKTIELKLSRYDGSNSNHVNGVLEDKEEAYFLEISQDKAAVHSLSMRGLLHGLSTIENFAKANGGSLPIGRMLDWPDTKIRAFHSNIFGKNTNFKNNLQGLIRQARREHYNALILTVRSTDLRLNSLYCQEKGTIPYERDDFQDMMRIARENGLEAIPGLKLLTHQEKFLKPCYPDWMLKKPNGRPSAAYNPAREEVSQKVFSVVDEVLDLTGAKKLHIGLDELANGAEGVNLPIGQFDQHVKLVNDYLKNKEVETWMWADMLCSPSEFSETTSCHARDDDAGDNYAGYTELRNTLPKDIVMGDWHYHTDSTDFPSARLLKNAGFKVLGVPWFKKTTIRNFSSYIDSINAEGMIASIWYWIGVTPAGTRNIVSYSGKSFWDTDIDDVVLDFSSNPFSIAPGQTATLSWQAANADSCVASGAWSGEKQASGSQVVSPSATSIYNLTCSSKDGSASRSVNVTVAPPSLACPNSVCDLGESCSTCPADCGECPPGNSCGNGNCQGQEGENCQTCPADCGSCEVLVTPTPTCPDGQCKGDETCTTCEADCGACTLQDAYTPTAVVKGTKRILSPDKPYYTRSKEVSFKGKNPEIAKGKVRIFENGKTLKIIKVKSSGSWSGKINTKKSRTFSLEFRFYDQTGAQIHETDTFQVVKVK